MGAYQKGRSLETKPIEKVRPEKKHPRKERAAGGVTQEGKNRKPRVDLAVKEAYHEDIRLQDAHPLGVPLAQLSFEERMAYYKKKYNREAEAGAMGTEKPETKKRPSGEPQKRRNQRNSRKRSPAEQDTPAKGQEKAAKAPIEPGKSEPKFKGTPSPTEKKESPKGIFSQLLGILRPKGSKKPSSESKDT
jgi:hypothetical protein